MNNYFRYSNDTCPICGELFTAEDDIVVCPLCGTPHHRACYNKNGECGNESKHSDGFHWTSSAEPQPDHNPYEQASEQGQDGQIPPFAPMYNPFNNLPENMEDDIPTLEAAAFVQSGSYRYCQKFFFEKSGKKTFNWAAFIFAPYWFFFRKMYKLGIIFTVLLLLLSTTAFLPAVKALNKSVNEVYYQYTDATSREDLATFSDDLADAVRENKAGASILFAGYAVQFAIAIVAGFIANKSYYKHVIAKIRNIHQTAQTPDLARIRSQREGGVNIIAPLAVVFLIEGVSTLLQTLIK